jgi:hypothetical protein
MMSVGEVEIKERILLTRTSGVARGYARYALAYPAIPANTSIYTYFIKKAYKCVVAARLKLSCVT